MIAVRSRCCRPMAGATLLLAAVAAGCRTPAPEAGPDRAATSVPPLTDTTAAAGQPDRTGRGYTAADAQFMRHMIAHHAQALAMTSLVPDRSRRDDVRLLAERIEISQRDEIAAMERWLRARGEEVPGADPAHRHHAAGGSQPPMPGMLTDEEMARLARTTGAEFDRLFLEFMIRHHEGALTMVAALFASRGAGQDSEIYRFASDIDAGQRAEIRRMRALQGAPPA